MSDHSLLAATLAELDTSVIDQSPAALCVCRAPHGEIIRYNAAAVAMWGRTPGTGERLTGAWRTRSPDGGLISPNASAVEAVLSGGAAVRDRHVMIERPDGTSVAVTAHVSPLQDASGRLVGAISAFEELTPDAVTPPAQVALHRDLLESRWMCRDTDTALHGVVDSALIGVWTYDLCTGRAVRSMTNDQIFGYLHGFEEWSFDTFLEHVTPEDRNTIRTRLEQCAVTGEVEFDCRIIRVDGSPAWISSRGRLVRDAGGAPARIVGIVTDVTRQRASELAHQRDRRRHETFVSTLAHELRQPLAALLAAVEVIRVAPDSAAARRATDIMKRQISQMDRVIEDLVDATRWARGKVPLRTQRLDLRAVVNEAAQDILAAVAARGHELVVTTTSEPLWADADPQRLQQVFSNLLRNAVKYTEPGGRIDVSMELDADSVTVRVSDTGCGIERGALTDIFELFSQVRPSDSSGLGIGLSVVREIVGLHGGQIEARSEGPGRGSQFIVRLPAAHPPTVGQSAA